MSTRLTNVTTVIGLWVLCSGVIQFSAYSRQRIENPCERDSVVVTSSPISLRVTAPSRVAAGKPIPLTLILTNHGNRAATISYGGQAGPASKMPFDFRVTGASDGSTVWHRLEGVVVEDVGNAESLPPGDSLVFTDRWLAKTHDGQSMQPGIYCVRGALYAEGVSLDREPISSWFGRRNWLRSEVASVKVLSSEK